MKGQEKKRGTEQAPLPIPQQRCQYDGIYFAQYLPPERKQESASKSRIEHHKRVEER
jgi:hypothetical protein